MSGKMSWCLIGVTVLAFGAGQAQGASPYDRAAYVDATYATSWAGRNTALQTALQAAGYTVVDAAGLKAFMVKHIADKAASVVVFVQDDLPDTVGETEDTNCTLRKYLDAGGKVVWYADIPLYYRANAGGATTTWGTGGSTAVLGFNASPNTGGASWDTNAQVTITPLGVKWGLKVPWATARPALNPPAAITGANIKFETLATMGNGAGAAGWVAHYVAGDTFRGFVRIDDHSGNQVDTNQLIAIAEYFVAFKTAAGPVPSDGATDVPRDAITSWTASQYPVTHDVYFGSVVADVNSASRTSPKGVLLSKGQADMTFDPPGSLAYGQTYYWRVDEVNKSADGTINKGSVWSFTVEPYGYPITKVTATASSAQASMGPEKTIDGSGMTGDLHGTDGTTMWLSTGTVPNWIQYQFDNVYKVYDLKVWNSNQLIETFLGFGAKDVKVEYSADGTTWTALANVPQFARAPGLPNYTANTTVSFGGVMAKYVKLTINSNWGGMGTITGLAEVRFSYVPVQARTPQPATAATGVDIAPTLTWRPGREAGSHQVFFGADQTAVTNGTVAAKTVTDHAFTPGSLNFGTTYYWRVDEVNTTTYPGTVWSFTTQEYAAVDNFESYNDTDNRIYDSWIDGLTDGKSGSTVGYMAAPFAEQTIIHGGHQSMPFEYNDIKTPYYSEATRTFAATQDWTTNSADTLSLWFRGRGEAFTDNGDGTYAMTSSGTDIWNNGDQFRFAYKSLSGDGTMVARVDSVANTNVWAKAGVMIRQSVDPASTHAFMPITPGGSGAGNGASFQRRLTAAGASTNDDKPAPAIAPPYWVKIQRTGNSFSGYISPDGKTWTQLGTAQTITMTNPVLIGLAVCSHDATLTTTATFSNVSTTGTVTGSWQVAAIGMAMPTNGPAPLYLTVTDKAGKTKTVVNPNPSASATPAWTEWRIPLSSLTGVSLTTVQKLTLGAGDKTSPKGGAAGMLYFDDIGYGHPVK